MININEYLISKNKKSSIISATNYDIFEIVRREIETLGENASLNHIDVSQVTDFFNWPSGEGEPENITGLFEGTGFYGDVSGWDMSNAKIVDWMFKGCENFDCDISRWDMSNVETCRGMFSGCKAFFQDLTKWNMKNVRFKKDRHYMFEDSAMIRGMQYWPKFGY